MYYIYEIEGVKVGCTTDIQRRQKQQLSLGKMIVLEEYTNIEEASRREKILQREKGYRVDSNSYTHSVNNAKTVCCTPEAIIKRESKQNKKVTSSHLQRGVVAIDKKGIRTIYSGMNEASRQLLIKTGIKFDSGYIGAVCNPNRVNKTYKGYTFEYADR